MLLLLACAAPFPDADTVAAEALSRFDADRDGVVTAQEYAPFGDDFALLDTDRDGRLTPAEFRDWLASDPDARMPRPPPSAGSPPPPPPTGSAALPGR